ncbi:DDE-type integrase/transposase/recombinase [Streptomyces sp. NPDC090093]|uniref:DDE-type integrase/transposase/recombinase n=1 Tax=Streptomyces sp. NPDC090093 TaxID=3365945 RepID=UPI00381CA11B
MRRSRRGHRSGYCAWRQNKETRQEKADAEGAWPAASGRSTPTPGSLRALRITRKIRDQGHVVNRKRVARIMRERETAGMTRPKSRSLKRRDRAAPPAPDLILWDVAAPVPGLKCAGCVTCLPTAGGRLCRVTVIDLCALGVVGWSTADRMRTELAADAIRTAQAGGHAVGKAIFHSDRGSQYTSNRFPALPGESDVRQSAGRAGSCLDDALAESFFAVLGAGSGKTVRESRARARQGMFRRTAEHDNRERLHPAIGYVTPHQARVSRRQRLDPVARTEVPEPEGPLRPVRPSSFAGFTVVAGS